MAGLQRSEISFRRSGSSGLVWDDKLVSGELKKLETGGGAGGNNKEDDLNREATSYKAIKVDPAYDPPSPRVSGCGACGGLFGKPASTSHKRKSGAAGNANNHRRK